MVGRALIVCAVACVVAAPARAETSLPDCAPPDIDVALLRELLAIELGELGAEVRLGEQLCDPRRTEVTLTVRDAAGHEARDVIALSSDTESDPRAAARAIALAIAERAPRLLASLAGPAPTTPTPVVSPTPTPTQPADASTGLTPPPESAHAPPPASDHAPPPASDHAPPPAGAQPPPSASAPPPPALSPLGLTLGASVHGRLGAVLPSWALGLGVELGGHLDPTWSLRGELFSTWSRAGVPEGNADAVVLAGAAALTASVTRTASIDLVFGARAEAGMVVAMGWLNAASSGSASVHPWLALGGVADLAVWLSRGVAFVVDLSVSAVLYGVRLRASSSGVLVDLSILDVDLATGLRVLL